MDTAHTLDAPGKVTNIKVLNIICDKEQLCLCPSQTIHESR